MEGNGGTSQDPQAHTAEAVSSLVNWNHVARKDRLQSQSCFPSPHSCLSLFPEASKAQLTFLFNITLLLWDSSLLTAWP